MCGKKKRRCLDRPTGLKSERSRSNDVRTGEKVLTIKQKKNTTNLFFSLAKQYANMPLLEMLLSWLILQRVLTRNYFTRKCWIICRVYGVRSPPRKIIVEPSLRLTRRFKWKSLLLLMESRNGSLRWKLCERILLFAVHAAVLLPKHSTWQPLCFLPLLFSPEPVPPSLY